MEETTTAKKGRKIEDLVVESLTILNQQDHEALADIDAAQYGAVNVSGVIAGKMLSSLFSDQELFDVFNNGVDSKQNLCVIATAEAYALQTDDASFKEKLKEIAKSGNPKAVLDFVSAHNFATIDEKKLSELLEDRIAGLLSIPKKVSSDKEYVFEELTGKLGKGLRISSNDYYFEHRNIGTNSILRITKGEKGYKAQVYIEQIMPKDSVTSYILLHETCEEVLKLRTLDSSGRGDLKYYASSKPKRFEEKRFEKKYGQTRVIYNGKDNNFSSNFTRKKNEILYNTDVALSVTLGSAGFIGGLISIAEGHPEISPFFFSGLAFGITSGIYFGVTNKGLIGNIIQSHAMKDYKNKYSVDDSSLREFMRAYNGFIQTKDTKEETNSRIKAQDRLDKIKDTFNDLQYRKGYVVEFVSESLDDIYLKSHAIIQKMNKVN